MVRRGSLDGADGFPVGLVVAKLLEGHFFQHGFLEIRPVDLGHAQALFLEHLDEILLAGDDLFSRAGGRLLGDVLDDLLILVG